ncbi:MAG: hypothetical protein ACI9OJ_003356 [Myxococcota bacterium]|jgi:hypothetical protein
MRVWILVGFLALGCSADGETSDGLSDAIAQADSSITPSDIGNADVMVPTDTSTAPDDVTLPNDLGQMILDVEPPQDTAAQPDGSSDAVESDTSTEPADVSVVEDLGEPDTGTTCEPVCDDLACDIGDGCGGTCVCSDDLVCFLGQCTMAGGCTTGQDAEVLATVDIGAVVGECAPGCLLAEDKATCGSDCISEKTALTAACSGCFGGTVACTFDNCTLECGFGSAEACTACQAEAGCFDAFEACAGVPALGT